MKIDYMKLLKESFDFTLKYKALWIFGFLLALFGAGSGGGGNFTNGFSSGSGNWGGRGSSGDSGRAAEYLEQAKDGVMNILQQPWFWLLVAGIALFLIVWIILSIYFTTISKIALMKAVKHDADGKSELITFKKLWAEAGPQFLKLFLFQLAYGVVTFLIAVVLLAPMLLAFFAPIILCGLIFIIPLMIVIMVIASYIEFLASRMIVLEGTEMMDAVKKSWKLFKVRWLELIISSLVMILPGLAYGFVMLFGVLLILGIFVLGPVVLLFVTKAALWTIILTVLGIIASILLISAIEAPYQVFSETYLTKVYMLIAK